MSKKREEAFEKIYESTKQKILVYIISKCQRTADIEDIFQETYLELFKVIETKGTNYITNEQAFLIKLAKQKIYRHYTLKDKLKKILSLEENISDIYEDESFQDIRSLEDEITDRMMAEQILCEIQNKSEDIQKIFYLYYNMDLKLNEIAVNLSMSESNVKHKLYRTLQQIRNSVNKEDGV